MELPEVEAIYAEKEEEMRRKKRRMVDIVRFIIRKASVVDVILLIRQNSLRKINGGMCKGEDRSVHLSILTAAKWFFHIILVLNTAQPIDVFILEHFVA